MKVKLATLAGGMTVLMALAGSGRCFLVESVGVSRTFNDFPAGRSETLLVFHLRYPIQVS